MNTAQALEAITDRGKFELLVTPILRMNDKNYESIIHTGINAQGETIKSPLDGFCLVPDSKPSHFIFVAHTTTDLTRLEKKWLSDDQNNLGDLIKAGQEAKEIKSKNPDAKCTVILTTNQHLNINLPKKVYEKAEELKVSCDIWEQSRLRDFLDNTGEGHWLRRLYLGVEVELLSASLLKEVCDQSLKLYEKELFTNLKYCVPRQEDQRTKEDQYGKYTVQFLIAESGFGKSVIAFKTLKEHIENGGYGFWIPAEVFEKSMTFQSAIENILREMVPSLVAGVGNDVQLLIGMNSRILIVVDDINRTNNPAKLVQKVLALSRPQSDDVSSSNSVMFSYSVVCSIWPQFWEPISRDLSNKSWINNIEIGSMAATEGKESIIIAGVQSNIKIPDTEAICLSEKMGNDPVIIGLFNELLTKDNENDLNVLTNDVIERFINAVMKQVTNALTSTSLLGEFKKCLLVLSRHMLTYKRIYPTWEDIQGWLREDQDMVRILRELIKDGKLCKLDDQEKLVFRHDRILEYQLELGAVSILSEANSLANELLKEPFFSKIIGKALLRLPQNNDLLEYIKSSNILALFEAIRAFGTPTTDYHVEIIERTKEWVRENVPNGKILDSLLHAICWILIDTDSPAVLEITDMFSDDSFVLLARLRNGSFKSGALYCSRLHNEFEPAFRNNLRDRVIEKAKSTHREVLIKAGKEMLRFSNLNEKNRRGALILAGFLGFSEYMEEIAISWTFLKEKQKSLSETIWAVSQCCGNKSDKYLHPLMVSWDEMPDEKDACGFSQKLSIAEDLRFAFGRGIHNKAIQYFASLASTLDSLNWPITLILMHVDDPDAVEYITRQAAGINRRLAGTEKFSPWAASINDTWDSRIGGRRKLSENSLSRLKVLWESSVEDEYLRKQTFRLWLTGIGWKEINILRSISKNSFLSRIALWKRAELSDYTVVSDLVPYLQTDIHWFHIVSNVWCDQFIPLVESHLESFQSNIPDDYSGGRLDGHYRLSELLMMIPVQEAERMINKYWDFLGYSRLFIQAALYIGTSKCLELAEASIKRCPKNIDLFEHMGSQFGFMNSKRQKYVQQRHLESLLPYFGRMTEFQIWECVEVCQRLGIPEWSKCHLSKLLSEQHRKRYHPSDEDLLQDLNEFISNKHGIYRLTHWLEEFDSRHEPKNRIIDLLNRWFPDHQTIQGLRIVASCLEHVGTREDLAILDKYNIDNQSEEKKKIKASAEFSVYRRSLD